MQKYLGVTDGFDPLTYLDTHDKWVQVFLETSGIEVLKKVNYKQTLSFWTSSLGHFYKLEIIYIILFAEEMEISVCRVLIASGRCEAAGTWLSTAEAVEVGSRHAH